MHSVSVTEVHRFCCFRVAVVVMVVVVVIVFVVVVSHSVWASCGQLRIRLGLRRMHGGCGGESDCVCDVTELMTWTHTVSETQVPQVCFSPEHPCQL